MRKKMRKALCSTLSACYTCTYSTRAAVVFTICILPVVKDAVDHQPLHLNSIAAKLLLHVDKEWIFVLPLRAFVIITLASKVSRRRFIHVSLPLVVAEHHLAVQLQLGESKQGGVMC